MFSRTGQVIFCTAYKYLTEYSIKMFSRTGQVIFCTAYKYLAEYSIKMNKPNDLLVS